MDSLDQPIKLTGALQANTTEQLAWCSLPCQKESVTNGLANLETYSDARELGKGVARTERKHGPTPVHLDSHRKSLSRFAGFAGSSPR
jgi:hypothetical protein